MSLREGTPNGTTTNHMMVEPNYQRGCATDSNSTGSTARGVLLRMRRD
jgi:hypothetical protein